MSPGHLTTTAAQSSEESAASQPLVHLFAHKFGRGAGVEQYGLSLATSLSQAGWKVFFHARKADVELAGPAGVDLKLYPVSRFPRKLQDYRFFRIVRELAPTLAGIQLALTRVPVRDGVICGGTHRGYLKHAGKLAGPFDWLQIWMETQAYQSARHIVSSSFLCQREVLHLYGIAESRIPVLHPAVRDEFFDLSPAPNRTDLRKHLGLPLDRVVFLFPSGGHKRKGLYLILRAIDSLGGQAVLAVTGRRPKGARSSNLVSLGYVERLADAYMAADYTTLGSSYEPFGQVGPESILCGTPLVFEKRIGCLEVVQTEAVITFDVRDQASIAAALTEAVRRAGSNRHRIPNPQAMLAYEPRMAVQMRTLMTALRRGSP